MPTVALLTRPGHHVNYILSIKLRLAEISDTGGHWSICLSIIFNPGQARPACLSLYDELALPATLISELVVGLLFEVFLLDP